MTFFYISKYKKHLSTHTFTRKRGLVAIDELPFHYNEVFKKVKKKIKMTALIQNGDVR